MNFRLEKRPWAIAIAWLTAPLLLCGVIVAQTPPSAPASSPKAVTPAITKIDEKRFAELLKPAGKPLLINFWATWCEPCREEFPALVKIDAEYKGKIDFITISLDFEEELNTGVPKFLTSMKATMPTYVLITPDETAAISMVSKQWSGGLPFTVLYEPGGKISYFRQGIVRHDILQKEIDKVLAPPDAQVITGRQIVELPILSSPIYTYEQGSEAARKDLAVGKYRLLRYGLTPAIPEEQLADLRKKYSVTVEEAGCLVLTGYDKYVWGYNTAMKAYLEKTFGTRIRDAIAFATVSDPARSN